MHNGLAKRFLPRNSIGNFALKTSLLCVCECKYNQKLKEELELCVTRLQDSDDKVLINNKIGSFLDPAIVVSKVVNRFCNYLLSIIALPRSLGMYAKTYPCIYYINDFGPKAT